MSASHRTEKLCKDNLDVNNRKDYIGCHWNNDEIVSTVYDYGCVSNINNRCVCSRNKDGIFTRDLCIMLKIYLLPKMYCMNYFIDSVTCRNNI